MIGGTKTSPQLLLACPTDHKVIAVEPLREPVVIPLGPLNVIAIVDLLIKTKLVLILMNAKNLIIAMKMGSNARIRKDRLIVSVRQVSKVFRQWVKTESQMNASGQNGVSGPNGATIVIQRSVQGYVKGLVRSPTLVKGRKLKLVCALTIAQHLAVRICVIKLMAIPFAAVPKKMKFWPQTGKHVRIRFVPELVHVGPTTSWRKNVE